MDRPNELTVIVYSHHRPGRSRCCRLTVPSGQGLVYASLSLRMRATHGCEAHEVQFPQCHSFMAVYANWGRGDCFRPPERFLIFLDIVQNIFEISPGNTAHIRSSVLPPVTSTLLLAPAGLPTHVPVRCGAEWGAVRWPR